MVSATAVPPWRGTDHSTLCTSATSRSPDGARVAEPPVAAVKERVTGSAAAAPTGVVTVATAAAVAVAVAVA
ncbi:hypothetical protein GCM10020295_10130 [Streptomyces cinereospinus]